MVVCIYARGESDCKEEAELKGEKTFTFTITAPEVSTEEKTERIYIKVRYTDELHTSFKIPVYSLDEYTYRKRTGKVIESAVAVSRDAGDISANLEIRDELPLISGRKYTAVLSLASSPSGIVVSPETYDKEEEVDVEISSSGAVDVSCDEEALKRLLRGSAKASCDIETKDVSAFSYGIINVKVRYGFEVERELSYNVQKKSE